LLLFFSFGTEVRFKGHFALGAPLRDPSPFYSFFFSLSRDGLAEGIIQWRVKGRGGRAGPVLMLTLARETVVDLFLLSSWTCLWRAHIPGLASQHKNGHTITPSSGVLEGELFPSHTGGRRRLGPTIVPESGKLRAGNGPPLPISFMEFL